MRGSPHAHCLIWTKDGPDMATASTSEIEAYFAPKVTGQLPTDNETLHSLVDRVQRHAHSVACRKGKDKCCCRFNFPRPPFDRTMLTEPPTEEHNTRELQEWRGIIISQVQSAVRNLDDSSTATLDDILAELDITIEEYHTALRSNVSNVNAASPTETSITIIQLYSLPGTQTWIFSRC